MAQVNDIIKVRYGGCMLPIDVTVLEVDGGGDPLRVRCDDNSEMIAAEFEVWVGPIPKPNPRASRPEPLTGRTTV